MLYIYVQQGIDKHRLSTPLGSMVELTDQSHERQAVLQAHKRRPNTGPHVLGPCRPLWCNWAAASPLKCMARASRKRERDDAGHKGAPALPSTEQGETGLTTVLLTIVLTRYEKA